MSDIQDNTIDKIIDFEQIIYDIDKVIFNIINDYEKINNDYIQINNIKNNSLSNFNFITKNIK